MVYPLSKIVWVAAPGVCTFVCNRARTYPITNDSGARFFHWQNTGSSLQIITTHRTFAASPVSHMLRDNIYSDPCATHLRHVREYESHARGVQFPSDLRSPLRGDLRRPSTPWADWYVARRDG